MGRWPSAPLLQLVGADVAAFARGPLLPPLICALGPWAKMGEAGFKRDGVDRGATRKQGNRGVGPPCSPSSPSMGSAPTVSVPASGEGRSAQGAEEVISLRLRVRGDVELPSRGRMVLPETVAPIPRLDRLKSAPPSAASFLARVPCRS